MSGITAGQDRAARPPSATHIDLIQIALGEIGAEHSVAHADHSVSHEYWVEHAVGVDGTAVTRNRIVGVELVVGVVKQVVVTVDPVVVGVDVKSLIWIIAKVLAAIGTCITGDHAAIGIVVKAVAVGVVGAILTSRCNSHATSAALFILIAASC